MLILNLQRNNSLVTILDALTNLSILLFLIAYLPYRRFAIGMPLQFKQPCIAVQPYSKAHTIQIKSSHMKNTLELRILYYISH